MTNRLPDFEGLEVRKATVRITRAGDGLSEALAFEPVALHHGDRCFFVLEGVVTQVNHRPDGKVEDGEVDDLIRVHTVEAAEIAMVDEADVSALLEANRERLKVAKQKADDEAAGATRLPLGEEEHTGDHSGGLVDGCPACQAERDAEERESGAA